MIIPTSAKELIASGAIGHLATVSPGGRPQLTCVWVAVEGDDLLTAHLNPGLRKLENVRANPRVVVSFEGSATRPPGLREYLVLYGEASIEEGGAPELLQALAHVYLGPDVKFPPMADPPPGVRLRIAVDRVSGIGPWSD
jgi:PPOX class probable F420-dependent enzyme